MSFPSTDQIRDVRHFIAEHWPKTLRKPGEEPAKNDEIPLPGEFVVPTAGRQFHNLFYWDTYFACEGLARDGLTRAVRSTAENFLHLTETIGYIPNSAKKSMMRSQPPVSSHLYKLVYETFGDRTWLRRAARALELEHAFWVSLRTGPDGLAYHGHHSPPLQIRNFYWAIRDRRSDIPENTDAHYSYLSHKLAEAETGWDFNPRFSDRCMDFYPVDLNSLLYAMERHLAEFLEILGDDNSGKWAEKAEARQVLVNDLLWNEEQGAYFDFDYVNRRQGQILSAAAYFPLWCGLADEKKAARLVENLGRLETEHGLDTCEPGERKPGVHYQWDTPNAWPPMQFMIVAGLHRFGYTDEARRLARGYVKTVTAGFEKTQNLWEKYNVRTGGVDVVDEYAMPPMLGWTAGTYLYALDILKLLEETQPAESSA